jgi:hypothetical protein
MTNRFAIGDVVSAACKQYAAVGSAACAQLQKDVRLSQGGNTGKRAGLICSLMGECDAVSLASSCQLSVAASSTLSGPLDLCTVEGVVDATAVQGISQTVGECCVVVGPLVTMQISSLSWVSM